MRERLKERWLCNCNFCRSFNRTLQTFFQLNCPKSMIDFEADICIFSLILHGLYFLNDSQEQVNFNIKEIISTLYFLEIIYFHNIFLNVLAVMEIWKFSKLHLNLKWINCIFKWMLKRSEFQYKRNKNHFNIFSQ